MPLHAIGFDLWETLLTNPLGASKLQDGRRIAALSAVFNDASIPHDAASVELAYRELWNRCHELYWSKDLDVPTRRHVEHLLEAMPVDATSLSEDDLVRLERAYSETILEHPPELVPAADEILRTLRKSGYRLGLISNTGRTPGDVLRRVLDRMGIGELFDVMLFSNEIGVCKPQRQIYESMLVALGSAAEAAVFVGDNIDVDVFGAQQIGMRGVHFAPAEKGTAVAPPVERDEPVRADATIGHLRELLPLVEQWNR